VAGPQVLALLKKRREKWVDLGDGRKVKFLRPSEIEYGKMLVMDKADPSKASWSVGAEDVRRCVCDWEGFSEASILGPEIGASDVMVPFDKELFDEMVSDEIAWVSKVANAILDSIVEHIESRTKEAKNLLPA
jgi:hypothetical protein